MRDDEIYRALGGRLRARRRMLDMTQREVALRCGLTFQQIQKYEAGLVAMPVARLVALAQALETPVSELVGAMRQAPLAERPAERPAGQGAVAA